MTVTVEKIIPEGKALATLESGKKAFFWGALPGEEVLEYDVIKEKPSYLEAIATKITNCSPHRVSPKDLHYLSTSPWQIMDYEFEENQKKELVVEIFKEHHINISIPELLTDSKMYFYRNKMEYSLYWDNNQNRIRLAFRKRGSHQKIPIETSSLERPEIFMRANNIIDELNKKNDEARKYQSLLLRCNKKGEVSGGLYKRNSPHPIFNNLTDDIMDHTYSYSPNGFFQINIPVYKLALKEIKKHIITDKVLDLYAGVGTIGLSVASDKNLTLVEVDKFAYSELIKNYKEISKQSSTNSSIILAKSEEALNYISPDQTVILDPPRAGCDKKLIDKLLEVKPEVIIYLSCNPATQARDIKLLLEKYQIKDIKVFNFFPRTPHIENLVILYPQ